MKLKLICLLALLLYLPSFFNYFSRDDFFLLQLAKVNSPTGFWHFFDFINSPDKLKFYRPLTAQTYFLISYFFNLSPYPLHIISFITFLADIYLVYLLAKLILHEEKASLITTFLYAVSATHFAQLYWPSIYQELGLIFFFLLAIIFFLKKRTILSLLMLIGALLSKETAIMIPAVLTGMVVLEKNWRRVLPLIPYWIIIGLYLYVHLAFFGLPTGGVYTMDFSPKILNTLSWYLLWSFNLPELLVDYIGPGFHLNPNLFRFHGLSVLAIVLVFLLTMAAAICAMFKTKKWDRKIIFLSTGWFLATLLPVIFLPWHKFTYNLGVPLVGITLFLGWLLKMNQKLTIVFCASWLLTSVFTNILTYQTHWIITGSKVAQRIEKYFSLNHDKLNKNIVFYDTAEDKTLPWSPENEVKIDLSNNDFFTVYYPGRFKVSYLSALPTRPDPQTTYIPARQFLGY